MALLVLSLLSVRCPAQSWQGLYANNINMTLTPPSPTAASFQRFAITPINYNAGLPDIHIPVYDLKAGDLDMPITLSYHYNGLKPRDEASWVGMGWNLSAGGCITRMKRGATDGSRLSGNNYDEINALDSVNNYGSGNGNWPFKIFLYGTFFNQLYDTEPDIYIFNFMGHCGKFLVVKGKAFFTEFEKWKVTKLSNDAGFWITDENGNQYVFSTLEMTAGLKGVDNDPREPAGYVSAWYLTRVTSADQQHWMSFAYTPYRYQDAGGVVAQRFKVTYYEALANYACTTTGDYFAMSNTAPDANVISGNTLTTITTSANQTIKLIQSPLTRKDGSTTEGALAQVVVYGQSGNPDTVIKRTTFQYGYFGDSTSQVKCWLKLHGVFELSATGDTLNNYSFDYQNEFGLFPIKTTIGVDQFGYYNGGGDDPTTGSLLPEVSFATWLYGNKETLNVPYGNINPNSNYCQYGLINKVHYPTGGYTQYTYEPNKYVLGVTSNPVIWTQQVATNTLVNTPPPPPGGTPSYTGTFTIPDLGLPGGAPQMAYIYYDRVLYSAYTDPKKEFNTPVILRRFIAGSCTDSTNTPCQYDTLYTGPALYTTDSHMDSLLLGPGIYSFIQTNYNYDSLTHVAITYQVPVQQNDQNGPDGPGLRIASITSNTDPTGSAVALQKSYTYTDSTGACSGFLSQDPKYQVWRSEEASFASACSGTPLITYNLSSDNNGIYNANLNFKFYYKAVREYTAPSNSAYYYTDHYFDPILQMMVPTTGTIYQNVGPDITNQLNNVSVNEDLLLTDPVEVATIHWRNSGGVFSKVSMETTAFNEITDTSITGIKPISLSDDNKNLDPQATAWGYNQYHIYCAWRYPTQKVEAMYDSLGNSSTVTTTYFYNTSKRELAATRETINNGASIVTKYKYADDYDLTDTLNALLNANLLGAVIETQIWKKRAAGDSSLIKGVINAYDKASLKPAVKYFLFTPTPLSVLSNETIDSDSPPGSPLYSSFLSDAHYKEKVRYLYDGRGNILEATLDSNQNVPTAYLWGYHYTYPVAKVVGARFAAVKALIDTAALQSITNDATMRSTLAPLRTIAGAQATIYTYAPFVGVTSQTDLNGETTYFQYDEFNRLKTILDFNLNVLKSFAYQYAPRSAPLVAAPSTISVTNSASASGFTVTFVNTSNGAQYDFLIPAAGGTLGAVPIGTYNITIAKTGNATSYGFHVSCVGQEVFGTSAAFSNVAVTATTCNGLSITTN
jgi:hypothetical protein